MNSPTLKKLLPWAEAWSLRHLVVVLVLEVRLHGTHDRHAGAEEDIALQLHDPCQPSHAPPKHDVAVWLSLAPKAFRPKQSQSGASPCVLTSATEVQDPSRCDVHEALMTDLQQSSFNLIDCAWHPNSRISMQHLAEKQHLRGAQQLGQHNLFPVVLPEPQKCVKQRPKASNSSPRGHHYAYFWGPDAEDCLP